ncbi:MAG: HEPN domain-containing protein [Gracilibacteraceae bacterium]|jgi:HEPN domain-containing protein|nr:HEPN domain-containing protein [Gracilibacteraceae bacterium]
MSGTDLVSKWFEKATVDLRVAKRLLEDFYPKELEAACFHAQQSAEKALKAFLSYHNIEPPKTHDLIRLCQMCEDCDDSFHEFIGACGYLTPYAVIVRYPDEIEIVESQAQKAVKDAGDIYTRCADQVQKLRQSVQEQQ